MKYTFKISNIIGAYNAKGQEQKALCNFIPIICSFSGDDCVERFLVFLMLIMCLKYKSVALMPILSYKERLETNLEVAMLTRYLRTLTNVCNEVPLWTTQ